MAISKTKRKQVYAKFNGHCAYCGEKIEYSHMQVDHIIPRSNFWTCIMNKFNVPDFLKHLTIDDEDHIDNLHPSCIVDNRYKDSFPLEQFRIELQAQYMRAKKQSKNYRLALRYNQIVETPNPIVFYFEKHNDG